MNQVATSAKFPTPVNSPLIKSAPSDSLVP